jgi:hypothetical protein
LANESAAQGYTSFLQAVLDSLCFQCESERNKQDIIYVGLRNAMIHGHEEAYQLLVVEAHIFDWQQHSGVRRYFFIKNSPPNLEAYFLQLGIQYERAKW